ncbi:MAG TPA: polyprenyl synthetase family protein, partial [Candidatus Sulfotelmatobacter sp.]|nr:polyprenyl synthetase family protein [Candidatus Sulfotelmatobacter sp.]
MVTSVSRLAYHAPTRETVPRLLTRHTHLIEESLRLAALPPASPLGRMCGYHMGWLDADGSPRDASRGKLIRPSLCVWACESLSAPASQALPAAVALELIHNFTLVHDDIQDGDARRRHRPSVWTVWGQAQGINAGDGLFALAYTSLLARGAHPSRRLKAGEVISRAVLEVINGQCLDLTLEGRLDTSPAAYMRMVSAKTGALLGASLEAGAVLAGASARVARSFRRAGRLLGLAFQIRDDWLGVWGDPALTGKGKESDLGRRKITYPIVAAYAGAPASLRRE